ncbi:MAG: hypothetical protein HOO95_05590 [Gallionella sp.]|nr:hypothetical protein [Gallionella sp.]
MENKSQKSCFVIMPITDPPEYDNGHFKRVYEHLIRPTCAALELNPIRADDVKSANHIILDILQRIVTADIVICDLSSKNANVMYELGVRQAFNLPVVLIKDSRTERVFDIQGLRTVDYDEKLRIDCVNNDIKSLTEAIKATIKPNQHDVNSLVKLLSIKKAELPKNSPISDDTALILASLRDVSARLLIIEQTRFNEDRQVLISSAKRHTVRQSLKVNLLPRGEEVTVGEEIFDSVGGKYIGKFVGIDSNGVILRKSDNTELIIPPDNDLFNMLSTLPF